MRRAGALAALLLAATATSAGAATWPQCIPRTAPVHIGLRAAGRTVHGRLVTLRLRSRAMGNVQPVNVLLPRGYDRSGRTRYPVLYLLHGAGGDYRSWMEGDHVDRLLGSLPVIAVMPSGSEVDAAGQYMNGGYSNWFGLEPGVPGLAPAWESYHIGELVPWIDAHFPTHAAAAGRAIVGISMGGGGAMKYAAEYPGTFGYAGSFSGELDPELPVAQDFQPKTCIHGDPATEPVLWQDNNPTHLAANLRGIRLFVRVGDGQPGPYDSPAPPEDPVQLAIWQTRLVVEAGANLEARSFVAAAHAAGIGVDALYRHGSHSRPYWQQDMREYVGWLREQLRHPPRPPGSFTVTSAHTAFTAWGWRFSVHHARPAFVTLHVTPRGIRASGEGRVEAIAPAGRRFTASA